MNTFAPGQIWKLLDATESRLGLITIERSEDDLVMGRFDPDPSFASVAPLFANFAEVANEQLFHHLDDIDRAIQALRLHLGAQNGLLPPTIDDVQIGEGCISFRVRFPESQAESRHPVHGRRQAS